MPILSETISQLPAPHELKRRAQVFGTINQSLNGDEVGYFENFESQGFDHYFWENGAGEEFHILFRGDDEALIYGYDHENNFATYDADDEPEVDIAFDDISSNYVDLIHNSALFWVWDQPQGKQKVYATSAVWWNQLTQQWEISDAWATEVAEENEDGGLSWFTGYLRPELTVQNLQEYYFTKRSYERTPELEKTIQDAYAKFYN